MLTRKKAKETNFFIPYISDRNCTLKTTGTGIYFFKDIKTNKILYVGFSGKDVKGTAYRHLQEWNDKRTDWTKKMQAYERVTFSKNKVLLKVIFCATIEEAALMEKRFILRLKPAYNTLKMEMYSQKEITYIDEKISNTTTWKANDEESPF